MNTSDKLNPAAAGKYGGPVIFDAVLSTDVLWVQKLLAAGADVNVRNDVGETPALTAALADQWIICLLLLRHGADFYSTNMVGSTIAYRAYDSRVKPGSPQGEARDQVVAFLKAHNVPFPPHSPAEVRKLQQEHEWPPKR